MSALWRRWTAPTADGEVAQRREAVLFSVLAGMVVLSGLTLVVQLVGLAFRPRAAELGWIGLDLAVGAGCGGLLALARRGRRRPAALTLVAIAGALVILLLVVDGSEQPMWSVLSACTAVLATILLGGRGGLATIVIGAVVLVPVVVAQSTGALDPLTAPENRHTGEVANAVEIVALLGGLAAICWIYTRDVLLSVDQQLARGSGESPLRQMRTGALTMREVEVVQLVAAGRSNDAIAGSLFVSPRTVHTHVANAMRKCGCSNRTELGVLAVREGLVPLEPTQP